MKLIKQVTAMGLAISLASGTTMAGEWPSDLVQDMDKAARAIADNWIDDRNPEKQEWAWGEGADHKAVTQKCSVDGWRHVVAVAHNWTNVADIDAHYT